MDLFQLAKCIRGKHHRSHRLAWTDGDKAHSRCTGCGKALVKVRGEWRLDHDPPPDIGR